MNRDEILNEVNSFLSMRYFNQVDASEEDKAHFVNILADCAGFVLGKYLTHKNRRNSHDRHHRAALREADGD